MFVAQIRETICIAHRVLSADGKLGPLHGHNWTIEVSLGAESLDERGLVGDAPALRRALHEVVDSIDHRTLDDLPAFLEPSSRTAPAFAHWVAQRLGPELPSGLALVSVRVVDGTGAVVSWAPRGVQ
ncbi:MAG: 6-carboxytetrahydropterin synthase [Deltaproteobacteria bacterium]|nr:6-carboxytetrahydropterin synthase [Deltaproteobacteria bacterium]